MSCKNKELAYLFQCVTNKDGMAFTMKNHLLGQPKENKAVAKT